MPILPEVVEVMNLATNQGFGDPDEFHNAGRKANVLREEARVSISTSLNCLPEEIFFIHNEEEALRTVLSISGLQNLITSKTEPLVYVDFFQRLFSNEIVFINHSAGKANLSEIEKIENNNALVFLSHANSETGMLLQIKKAAEICQKSNHLFFCNLTETLGNYNIDIHKFNLDMAMGFARTIHGPQGIGFLFIKKELLRKWWTKSPFYISESINIPAIVGLARALKLALRDRVINQNHIAGLKNNLIAGLKECIPEIKFNGGCDTGGLYSLVSATFPDLPVYELLAAKLDMNGVCVHDAHNGDLNKATFSPVIKELGVSEKQTTLRFSFGKQNSQEEIKEFIQVLTYERG